MGKNLHVELTQMKLWVRTINKKKFFSELVTRFFSLAHGAAIQGAILAGDKCVIDNEIVIIDVNPLTMGIEVKDGAMADIIPRNSQIPITKKKPFTTVSDNQEVVGVRIFEGERPLAKHNHFLGEFDLTGIPFAARGVPEIDVTFDIDVNGILNVSIQLKSLKN